MLEAAVRASGQVASVAMTGEAAVVETWEFPCIMFHLPCAAIWRHACQKLQRTRGHQARVDRFAT